ncbi:MAG TPA: GvpL/GvpF family gas vesicle protein [Thermomicrobiaceae bacterium]|nr:GvpL/GvpF family gas vesicle protein [Thermomicrobiaceae bacterium]
MSHPTLPPAGTYLYGIGYASSFRDDSAWPDQSGIGGDDVPVRVIEYGELAALVSDARQEHFDLTREHLLAHERVLEAAMERTAVLPVSFSTITPGDDEIRERLLKPEYDDLIECLAYVHERIELDLRVLWNRERLFAELVAENEDIQALRDWIAGQPEEATYYERIQLGEMTAAEIERRRERETASIWEALAPLAVEGTLNETITDMMLLNAAFLVDRAREPAFDARVRELAESQAERLIFRYIGPLPPYSFVNLRLDWE